MIGPPSCTAADFKKPRLRRCPFDPADLRFEARLGGGLDGYVWKVYFGDEGLFALKVVRRVPAGPTADLLTLHFPGSFGTTNRPSLRITTLLSASVRMLPFSR